MSESQPQTQNLPSVSAMESAFADLSSKVALQVQENLKETPFACEKLETLSGGVANFTYRGTLVKPLENGAATVVVKHGEGYAALSPQFKLDLKRCDYEHIMLTSLLSFPPTKEDGIIVQTQKLLMFDIENNTQIYEDLPSAVDLKNYCLNHPLSKSESEKIGSALGKWTKQFQTWGQEEEQKELIETMRGTKMKEFKFTINYDRLVAAIEAFPDTLEESREIFEKLRDEMKKELEDKNKNVLIHGDFWSGNVLLPSGPLSQDLKLLIIDWEFSQISPLAFDLGQMFAEIYQLKYFKNNEAGIWLIESFIEGYGNLDEELAFKVLIHVGVHFISFWKSRVLWWGTEEQCQELVVVGRDLIVGGWEKKRKAFGGSIWEKLFA